MQLDISVNSLEAYKALASETRLEILNIVWNKELNITQISEELGISKAITTRHVQQLIQAGFISYKNKPGISGLQKVILPKVDYAEINFPKKIYRELKSVNTSTKLGNFMDFDIKPTCGIASKESIIGGYDNPNYFLDPKRINAELLWFASGFVSYKIPNESLPDLEPKLLELTMEIASEFPNSSNIWPSDISFYINDIHVGNWTCPGNFSDVRGIFTPDWWNDTSSQYGILIQLMTKDDATVINGDIISNVVISDLNLAQNDFITLRIESKADAQHPGGVTLFGSEFGNHQQDINMNIYYS